MFGARTNCYGGHTEPSAGHKGEPVIKGTQKTCIVRHCERYGTIFEQWKAGIELTLTDAEDAYKNARKMRDENTAISPEVGKKAEELLAVVEADLRLVKRGNGIHNVTYALELLDSVSAHCQRAIQSIDAR